MTAPIPLYTMKRSVTDSDTDFSRRQKLSSVFGMFQDIAALHASNLGADVNWLRDDLGLAWILMRIRVEIASYPKRAQNVIVETWPQEPRALYDRDYMIKDADGNALIRAASTWVIMNLDTREIKRDKFLDYYGLEMKKERALGESVGRLKPLKDAEIAYEKEIKFSDVDYNNHVNNARYVDFIMDVFSVDEHRAREIGAIEVHYNNEIGLGDVLQLRRKNEGNGTDYIDGVRKEDGASVFNALVEWRILTNEE